MTRPNSTASAIAARISELHGAPETPFWEIGRLYNLLLKNQLWRQERFPGVSAFLAARTPEIPLASLALYGRVAEHFGPDAVRRHGVTRLALLVTYEQAFHGQCLAADDPSDVEIRVPQNGGPVQIRRFAEVCVNDLRNAIRRLRGARDSRALPVVASRRSPIPQRFPEDSLLGVLAVILGFFAIFIDVDRGGFVFNLGAIPVRAFQLGLALVVLGADFFLRRTGLLARLTGHPEGASRACTPR